MEKPKTIEEANALLLRRRKEQGIDETPSLAGSFLKTSAFDFKPPTPEEAAAIEARRQEDEARDRAEEARRAQEALRRRLEMARIPDRHYAREIDPRPEWQAVLESITKSRGDGYLVALLGIRGAGKTQLAVEAIRDTIEAGGRGMYVKALDLIIRFRESFRKDGPSERQVLEEFLSPDLLVIDAMEERGETSFEDRMISHLIDRRYDGRLDTILISNQTKEAFGQSIGNSAVSRIHETGRVFECNWESFRRKAVA